MKLQDDSGCGNSQIRRVSRALFVGRLSNLAFTSCLEETNATMQNDDTGRLLAGMPSTGSGSARLGTRQPVQPEHADSKTFFKQLILWIATIIWTTLIVTITKIYQAKDVITSAQKDTYNVLITVLILILGLSFFVSLPPNPT